MALSQTPWVSIFHQDDVMLPGHLASVIKGARGDRAGSDSVRPARGSRTSDRRAFPPGSCFGVDPGGKVVFEEMPGTLEFLGFPPGEFAEFLGRRIRSVVRRSSPTVPRMRRRRLRSFLSLRGRLGILVPGFTQYAVTWKLHEPPCWSAGTRPARPTASRRGWTTWRRPLDCWTPSSGRRTTHGPGAEAEDRQIAVWAALS